MTNDEGSSNDRMAKDASDFVIPSSLDIRHSSFHYAFMRASHLEDFYSFLRFPSVSTDDAFAKNVNECANWLVEETHGGRT